MFNLDLDVFSTLIQWLKQDKTVWLCTVTSTWGSAPRHVGSLMVCNAEGQQCGSLSGGCIEEDLLEKVAQGAIAADRAQHLIYGSTTEEQERFKLPCGGTLGVLIEPLTGDASTLTWVEQIYQTLEARRCIARDCDWSVEPPRITLTAMEKQNVGSEFQLQHEDSRPLKLHQVYGPQFHLFLIGISEVSRALAKFALLMDYRITVCDPRPDQIKSWDIDNVRLVQAMPDDAVLAHADDGRTAILALTHDPRIDDMGLLQAFNTKAFYIGAMGSEATSRKRRERLQLLEVSGEKLERLHAPIGLSIGSKTPAEIAIAALAEICRVRSRL